MIDEIMAELIQQQQALRDLSPHAEPIVQTSILHAGDRLKDAINLLRQAMRDEKMLAQLRKPE